MVVSGRRLVGDECGQIVLRAVSTADDWHGGLGCHGEAGLGRLGLSVVVVFTTHLRILGDPPLSVLSADKRAAHSTRDEAAEEDQDGGGQDQVGAPGHVRNEEQDINDKSGKTDEEVDHVEDEEDEQVPRGVGSGAKMGRDGQEKHDEGEECGNGVKNQDGGEGMANTAGQVEVLRLFVGDHGGYRLVLSATAFFFFF